MLKKFVNQIDAKISRAPRFAAIAWIRVRHAVWRLRNEQTPRHRFGTLAKGSTAFVTNTKTGQIVFLPDIRRAILYIGGVDFRLNYLIGSYCIDSKVLEFLGELAGNSCVVDVGAHAGELGIALRASGFSGRYIAIEPDPSCHQAIRLNYNDDSVLVTCAASDQAASMSLTLATSSGDSGFHSNEISDRQIDVEANTLDVILGDVLTSLDGSISLLKVEAEGHEPEVLRGASQILRRTSNVAIDFGPERSGEWTDDVCSEILKRANFCLLRRDNTRALFTNLKPPR